MDHPSLTFTMVKDEGNRCGPFMPCSEGGAQLRSLKSMTDFIHTKTSEMWMHRFNLLSTTNLDTLDQNGGWTSTVEGGLTVLEHLGTFQNLPHTAGWILSVRPGYPVIWDNS